MVLASVTGSDSAGSATAAQMPELQLSVGNAQAGGAQVFADPVQAEAMRRAEERGDLFALNGHQCDRAIGALGRRHEIIAIEALADRCNAPRANIARLKELAVRAASRSPEVSITSTYVASTSDAAPRTTRAGQGRFSSAAPSEIVRSF